MTRTQKHKDRVNDRAWEIRLIDPAAVQLNSLMTRRRLDDSLDEKFIESVTKELAHPICVRLIAPGRYEVILGARRLLAFKKKNIPLPCLIRNLDDREALWMAYEENVNRLDLDPVEEAEHILRLLDVELKGMEEYEACGSDPERALAVVYNARKGQGRPPKRIDNNVVVNLAKRLDRFFSSLPRSPGINAASFYVHKLPMLRIPADVHDELKRKVVHNSAGAQELFASIKDDLARTVTLDWISVQKRVPVRVLEKRVRALNWNAPLLGEIEDDAEKERVIRLVLERGLSPRSFELELRRLLPRSRESTMPFGVDGVQVYCPADSADMSQIEDGSVRLIVTSPPYGAKLAFEKDYLSKAETADEYFSLAEPITEECFRVLAPAGKMVVNWADPIGEWNRECVNQGEYEEHIYVHRWVELAQRVGFKLWARRIWHKNVYYSLAQNRVRAEDAFQGDGKTHLDWEWLLTFRKLGQTRALGYTALPYEKWVEYSRGVWYIPGAEEQRGLAVFPEELVSRLIQLYSFKGDVVLDPFLGSGTALAVAKALGRRAVGYEINPNLRPVIDQKISRGSSEEY